MSNGMYCSASQRIDSSSSSRVMLGRLIFFTITEWPETAVATCFDLMPAESIASRIASTMAPELRKAPCTIASAGNGATPTCISSTRLLRTAHSTTFTDEDPMSRPMIDLVFPKEKSCTVTSSRSGRLGEPLLGGRRRLGGAEHLVAVGNAHAERHQDPALRVEAARPARLDAVDGQGGEARAARELCLAHQQRLTEALDVVGAHRSPHLPSGQGLRLGRRDYRRALLAT